MTERRYFIYAAMAGLLLASCAKEEEEQIVIKDSPTEVVMTVIPEDCKTSFVDNGDGTYTPMWSKGDAISMSYAATGEGFFRDFNKKLDSPATGSTAKTTFSGIVYAPWKSGNYTFYGVYPHSAVKAGSTPTGILVDLPQTQVFKTGNFDPSADILVSMPKTISITNATKDLSSVSMEFTRIAALARIKVDAAASTMSSLNLDDKVLGVSLSNDAGVDFAGTLSVNPASVDGSKIVGNGFSEVHLTPEDAEMTLRNFNAILELAPCSLAAGTKLTITIRTATKVLSKTVSVPATVFKAGAVKELPCRIDSQWTSRDAAGFSGGSGTESDPYLISCSSDLWYLAHYCNTETQTGKYTSKYYAQIADIVSPTAINPIAYPSAFTGHYDGRGHSIIKANVYGIEDKPAGLFSKINGGSVKNLNVRNLNITAFSKNVGSIVGELRAGGVVSDCSYEGELVCSQNNLGAIVGYAYESSVNNCSFKGAVRNMIEMGTSSSSVYTGGIVGNLDGYCTSDGCSVDGIVFANCSGVGGFSGHGSSSLISNFRITPSSCVSTNENYAGGVVGVNGGSDSSLSQNCISGCNVECQVVAHGLYVGGVVGNMTSGNVRDCMVSSASKIITYKDCAGGIVGRLSAGANKMSIIGCATYCDVQANFNVGGIVGLVKCSTGSALIINCAHIGGKLYGTSCTSITKDSGKTRYASNVGGIVGRLQGGDGADNGRSAIVNCFGAPEYVAVNKEAKSPAMSGIAGLVDAKTDITCCCSNLSKAQMLFEWVPVSESTTGITTMCFGNIYGEKMDEALDETYHTNISYVYYNESGTLGRSYSELKNAGYLTKYSSYNAGNCGADLVSKLNSGVAVYNSTNPEIVAVNWIVGEDGHATLPGVRANPGPVKKNPLRISVFGDSISTFYGYIPSTNDKGCHYPAKDGSLVSVEETYWWQLAYKYMSNAIIDKNISWGGTSIAECDRTTPGQERYYGDSFVKRASTQSLGRPDIILLYGGTNDYNGRNVSDGKYMNMGDGTTTHAATAAPADSDFNKWYAAAMDDLNKEQFCPAYIHLVRELQTLYPKAKIVCIIGDRVSVGIEKSIIKIANHYGCRYVDLYAVNGFNENTYMPKHDVASGGCHPGVQGHAFIANKIYAELGDWLEGGIAPALETYSLKKTFTALYVTQTASIPISVKKSGVVSDYDLAGNPHGFKYTSSNPSAVKVNADGTFSAIAAGTSKITVSSSYGESFTYNVEACARRTRPADADNQKFPICAWFSLTKPLATHERFVELEDCGFTLSCGWCSFDYPDKEFFQKSLDASVGTGIKCFVMSSGSDDIVNTFKNHPQLAGYNITDEPDVTKFEDLAARAARIKQLDPNHIVYLNLFGNFVGKSYWGTDTYEEYLEKFLNAVHPAFLSYDHYPVMSAAGTVRASYYLNFEQARAACLKYNIPLWTFASSVNQKKEFVINNVENIRHQVYSGMAYGVQCMQYFTYCTPGPEHRGTFYYWDGPLDENGNKTAAWTNVKKINERLHKCAWIFKDCTVVQVLHLGDVPAGGTAYKSTLLPSPITGIGGSSGNLLISQISKGGRLFLVIVNKDNKLPQTVTISHDSTLIKIDDNGLQDVCPDKVTLPAGEMLILQVR